MSISTKEFKEELERLSDYFEREEIRFILCADILQNDSHLPSHLTNQPYIDAIILLSNTLLTVVEATYTDETASSFKSTLDKLIDELVSIHRQKESLKKESMSILSFKRKR